MSWLVVIGLFFPLYFNSGAEEYLDGGIRAEVKAS